MPRIYKTEQQIKHGSACPRCGKSNWQTTYTHCFACRQALYEQCYEQAKQADDAWQAELFRLFGLSAGDARYDQRGKSTPRLEELSRAKRSADKVLCEYNKK